MRGTPSAASDTVQTLPDEDLRQSKKGSLQVMPLPFGGLLEIVGEPHSDSDVELVELCCRFGEDWQVVSSPRSVDAGSDASWVLAA